jgi:hypothetical protein
MSQNKECCRAEKVHYVTPKVFAQDEPLPTFCGLMTAKAVTVDKSDATCLLCKKKLKAEASKEENW